MIHLLSMSIADYLFHRKIITIDKYPVYQYGLEMIISTILGVVLVLLCGVLTGSFLHSIIFYLLFVTLRMFTGGYHADTHFMCKLVLCGSFLTTNYICYLLSGEDTWGIYVSLALFNLITVIFFSPVECSKKPLTDTIKKRNKKISILLYIILLTTLFGLFYTPYNELALSDYGTGSYRVGYKRNTKGGRIMKFDNLLKKVANLAEFTAVKANGMTSWFDSYQPEEPKMVREMAEEKNLKDAE